MASVGFKQGQRVVRPFGFGRLGGGRYNVGEGVETFDDIALLLNGGRSNRFREFLKLAK